MKVDLIQNTNEWREFRNSRIGASDLSVILGVNPWMTAKALWEEKLKFRAPKDMTYSMQRGVTMEPIARDLLEKETGLKFTPQVYQHDIHSLMIASLDGVCEEDQSLCEIKCPGVKNHLLSIDSIVPDHYLWQIEMQFLCSEIEKGYYVSYNPDHIEQPLVMINISHNPKLHEFIITKVDEFMKCIVTVTQPEKFKAKPFLEMCK